MDSMDMYGFHGYLWNLWISKDRMDIDGYLRIPWISMDIYRFHGDLWIPWILMDCMDICTTQPISVLHNRYLYYTIDICITHRM